MINIKGNVYNENIDECVDYEFYKSSLEIERRNREIDKLEKNLVNSKGENYER